TGQCRNGQRGNGQRSRQPEERKSFHAAATSVFATSKLRAGGSTAAGVVSGKLADPAVCNQYFSKETTRPPDSSLFVNSAMKGLSRVNSSSSERWVCLPRSRLFSTWIMYRPGAMEFPASSIPSHKTFYSPVPRVDIERESTSCCAIGRF